MAFSNREGQPTRHFNTIAPKPAPEQASTGRRGRKDSRRFTVAALMSPNQKGGRPCH